MAHFNNGIILIPETTLPGGRLVPSFRVSQYYAVKNDRGKASINTSDRPWTDLSYFEANEAARSAGGSLLNESQALALAYLAYLAPENWSSGQVGVGEIKQGLHANSLDESAPGDFKPGAAPEDRWFQLSTGDRICDLAGNIFGWVFDDVQGDKRGIMHTPFSAQSPSITTAPAASPAQGLGWWPSAGGESWEGMAIARGGSYSGLAKTGIFRMSGFWPDQKVPHIGFRQVFPA